MMMVSLLVVVSISTAPRGREQNPSGLNAHMLQQKDSLGAKQLAIFFLM